MTTARFTLVFSTVASITLLSGGSSLWIASQQSISVQQGRILETATSTWFMGAGAIFGLLGGRGNSTPHSDSEEAEDTKE
jgi:hypothetical protein